MGLIDDFARLGDDDITTLSAGFEEDAFLDLSRVKDYFRRINGKLVRVKGGERKDGHPGANLNPTQQAALKRRFDESEALARKDVGGKEGQDHYDPEEHGTYRRPNSRHSDDDGPAHRTSAGKNAHPMGSLEERTRIAEAHKKSGAAKPAVHSTDTRSGSDREASAAAFRKSRENETTEDKAKRAAAGKAALDRLKVLNEERERNESREFAKKKQAERAAARPKPRELTDEEKAGPSPAERMAAAKAAGAGRGDKVALGDRRVGREAGKAHEAPSVKSKMAKDALAHAGEEQDHEANAKAMGDGDLKHTVSAIHEHALPMTPRRKALLEEHKRRFGTTGAAPKPGRATPPDRRNNARS